MLARGGQCLHSFQTKLVYTALHWVHCVKWRGRRGSGDLMLQIWEMRRIVNKWYNKVTMKGEQVQDLCDCVMLRGWQCTVYSVPYTGDSQISVLALKVKCLPKCCRQNNNWQEYDTPNYSSTTTPLSLSWWENMLNIFLYFYLCSVSSYWRNVSQFEQVCSRLRTIANEMDSLKLET